MRKQLARFFLNASLGLGLCAAPAAPLFAAEGPVAHGPAYVQPNCPYPVVPAPIVTPGRPSALPPGATAVPSTTTPSTTTPSTTTPSTTTPSTDAAAQQQAPTADNSGMFGGDAGAGAGAGDAGGPGAGEGGAAMIGRADAFSRFNLFDTQTAAPQTRVWMTFQNMKNFAVGGVHGAGNFRPTTANLYRAGAELALNCRMSLSVQEQYVSFPDDDDDFRSTWSNPQFMLKYALIQNCDTIVSGILGVQPEFGVKDGQPRDKNTRVFPGMLFYRALGENLFAQGGFQFGIPIPGGENVNSFDYALSLGYWLYRAPTDCAECERGWLTGIVPQVEILAQHVYGRDNINPQGGGIDIEDAQRHVYDATAGLSVMFGNLQLSGGYSVPLTGTRIRSSEFIANVQYKF